MSDFRFCGQCGKKLLGNPQFCTECGQKLSEKSQEENKENIESVDNQYSTINTESVDNKSDVKAEEYIPPHTSEPSSNDEELYRPKNPILILSIILVCLLLTGGIAFGVYYKTNSNNEKKKVESVNKILTGQKAQNIKIKVNQIDNQSFPLMKLYVSIMDNEDISIDNLPLNYFSIREKIKDSNNYNVQKTQVANQLEQAAPISVNLVMDTSGSMDDNFKLENAKKAATSFINIVNDSDQLEILEFNDFVRTKADFTNNKNTLIDAVSQLYTSGQTALYDSMYTALMQTSAKKGAKCVIVFTDGKSNKDTKSMQDVIVLAKKTGIPIYTIGIGNDVESQMLTDIATQTGGTYINTPSAEDLEKIYKSIFKIQKKQYMITYTSTNASQDNNWRSVELAVSSDKYAGLAQREFTSQVIKPSLVSFDIAKINDIIKTNADNANYSVVIKDLSNGVESRAGDYQKKMPASALINVPITLSIADMIKQGKISLNTQIPFYYTVGGRGKFTQNNNGELHTVDELLKTMMNYSDNNCSNTLLSYIGINEVNNIMHSYGFNQTELQRPLLVTDGSKENWTTCEDIGKMLELLYSDSLPIGSSYMNENFKILDNSKKDGILKYLPDNVFALHHNGVTLDRYNETAFIGNGSKKYILTVISCNGKQDKLAETTALISKYVYDEMLK